MNYLWQEFNIKTFPAETIVYRDGVFDPLLSTLESGTIDKKYDLPVHIIYIGEITGDNNLNINISVPDQIVFLTVKTENKTPAFLNILITNTGKKSFIKGKILLYNQSVLNYQIIGHHLAQNTGILIETKLVAADMSHTKLSGLAQIDKDCSECESDIAFSVLSGPNARIEFSPAQRINSTPKRADHSASIYKGTVAQTSFLREAGLSGAEVKTALEEAFTNDFLIF